MEDAQTPGPVREKPDWADIAIRLFLAALVAYWSFILLRPFIAILEYRRGLAVADLRRWRRGYEPDHRSQQP